MSLIGNLQKIEQCKEAIKNALIEKGVEDMDGLAFSDYADKIKNLQLSSGDTPSVPIPSVDYIYSNGYLEGSPTDIMTYVPYEIVLDSDNKFVIELICPVELMGWADVCPDIVLGVDVPTTYELVDIEVYDPIEGDYVPHGYKENIRHAKVVRDGVTYNSHLRNANGYYESNDVKSDPSVNYTYRITIKLI